MHRFVYHRFAIACASVLALWLSLFAAGATTLLVYNNNDAGAGSLRQAINDNNALGGGSTVIFSNIVTGMITLLSGELAISKSVTILGPGASVLTESGNGSSRVFNVTVNTAVVSISGLTIIGGRVSSADNGAGIYNPGTLTLTGCTLSLNTGAGNGGAIFDSGALTVDTCTFSGNSATNGGGAIRLATNATATIANSTFSGNYLVVSALNEGGGGICNLGGVTIVNCTFYGNSGGYFGGAIANGSPGFVTLRSSTIISNTASSPGSYGGGFHNNGSASVGNTVIAGNSSAFLGPDVFGSIASPGYNLIGKTNDSTGWGALGDQFGTINSPLDPKLGPLQNNGGATLTMQPLSNSPAIDQGNTGPGIDARGRYRPYDDVSIPNATSGDGSDIGAVEVSPPHSTVVTNNNDTGGGSLRYIVGDAQSGETVTFASNVVGTITLTSGELLIAKTLNIAGPGARTLAVNGNNSSRVFDIVGGSVLISGLTITNGSASFSGGGGILNQATLTVSNCAVLGNVASRFGGGISSDGTLTVWNSTIAGNQAIGGGESSGVGGGLYNCCAGAAVLVNSTIASNSVSVGSPVGGGIFNGSSLFLTNCTVAGNSSSGDDGGISNTGFGPPQATIAGSIIAGNTATNSNPDVSGAFTSGGYNLIGKTNGSTGFTNGVNQDQAGSIAVPLDPLLAALADYGGPAPTMALRGGSPAMDKGKSFGLTTDQRGAPRPFDFAVANASGGDGSDIGAIELGIPILNIQKAAPNVVLSWPAYYGDFTLEAATNLPASNTWSSVSGPPIVVGNEFNVTNGPANGNKFFRLRGP